jgi:hypothetical protein
LPDDDLLKNEIIGVRVGISHALGRFEEALGLIEMMLEQKISAKPIISCSRLTEGYFTVI